MYCDRYGAGKPRGSYHRTALWLGLLTCFFYALALPGCGRGSAAQYDRLAILRFENLSGDPSYDWVGRALSEAISDSLASAPHIYVIPSTRFHSLERTFGVRPVSAPGVSAERDLALASGATRLGMGEFSVRNGTVTARLTMQSAGAAQTEMFSASGPASDPVSVAAGLARQAWDGAERYQTQNPGALKAYVAALESNDAGVVGTALTQALAADPNYGAAWSMLAQLQTQMQDPRAALGTVEKALSQKIAPREKLKLEYEAAVLRGDAPGRVRALKALIQLLPADPVMRQSLAESELAVRNFGAAAESYRAALAVEPQNANALNQLGYAEAYAGNVDAAMDALRKYQTLHPAEANPLDSMGDVNLIAGRLSEAEKFYLQAAATSPHFQMDGPLFKAAMARLMTGDARGADGLAQRYLQARAEEKDPAGEYRSAEWLWASGRRREACRKLESFTQSIEDGPYRELASRASAELSVWRLMLGDRAGGAAAARKANEAPVNGAGSGITAVAAFLVQEPATAEEWRGRAERQFAAQPAIKNMALAFALLLQKDFAAASAAVKQVYDSGAPAFDEGLPALLAWTYVETGKNQEAAALLRSNPIPSSSGPGPFISFYFPRIFKLRGIVAERSGKRDEAAAQYALYRKLSGDEPLIWDK